VLDYLRQSTEGDCTTLPNGERWATVYLDNTLGKLMREFDMKPRSFAGYLGALNKAGLYRSFDDDKSAWGEVLLAE
jgi:hypothetical protein